MKYYGIIYYVLFFSNFCFSLELSRLKCYTFLTQFFNPILHFIYSPIYFHYLNTFQSKFSLETFSFTSLLFPNRELLYGNKAFLSLFHWELSRTKEGISKKKDSRKKIDKTKVFFSKNEIESSTHLKQLTIQSRFCNLFHNLRYFLPAQ